MTMASVTSITAFALNPRQDNNRGGKAWGYDAQPKKVLKYCEHDFGIPVIVFCYSVYIHSLVVSGLVESHIYRQDR